MTLDINNQMLDYDNLLNNLPLMSELIPYSITTVVVDSNVLIGDLRYMLRNGQMTTLYKLAKAKRIIIFFPAECIHEIEDHFPKVAKETHTTINEVREKWNKTYLRTIRLVDDLKPNLPAPLQNDLRDPKDVPFLRLFSFLSPEWFLTQDKDLLSLGIGNKNYVDILIDLREYHTGESILYTFSVYGSAIITLTGVPIVSVFYSAIKSLFHLIKNLPDKVKLVCLIVVISLLIWPKSRNVIKSFCLIELPSRLKVFWDGLIPALIPIFDYIETGQILKVNGIKKLREYNNNIPTVVPRTAKDYIFIILCKSVAPLTINQIALLVTQEGYTTTNHNFANYVLKVLRSDSCFSQVDTNKWILGIDCKAATN